MTRRPPRRTETFAAFDPEGTRHEITTSRKVRYAAFFKAPGYTRYAAHFASSKDAAASYWGAKTVGLTVAFYVPKEEK